jgi:uncharacterized repeat protein (TIGR01451 family)
MRIGLTEALEDRCLLASQFLTAPEVGPVGQDPEQVLVGDFNGDGTPDIATSNAGPTLSSDPSTVSVLLGNGDGTFDAALSSPAGMDPYAMAEGDFNGDGTLDLAVANMNSSSLSVLLGNGDGTFQAPQAVAVGSSPSSVAAADFNGDSKADLAVANDDDGTVSVLLGNGDGTFQAESPITVAGGVTKLTAGQFTSSGKVDLAVTSDNSVSILVGNGDGTFAAGSSVALSSSPWDIVAGDFSGDGTLDLAVSDEGTGGDQQGDVTLMVGKGDGTFSAQAPVTVLTGVTELAAADFNDDGTLDLATVSAQFEASDVAVLLNQGGGAFQIQTYAAGRQSLDLAAADFNGDGTPDLATVNMNESAAGGSVSLLFNRGDGSGTFLAAPDLSVSVPGNSDPRSLNPIAMAAGDLNDDGIPDVVTANLGGLGAGSVSVALGRGDGTFGPATLIPVANSLFQDVVIGDFNGDGTPDLAATDEANNVVDVFLGNGDGTFAAPLSSKMDYGTAVGLAAADFNGDGTLDLVVSAVADASHGLPGDEFILLGKGDGTFPDLQSVSFLEPSTAVAVGDFNGDGKPDFASNVEAGSPNSSTHLNVGLGRGDGGVEYGVIPTVADSSAIVTADLNGDGKIDVITTEPTTDSVTVRLNIGGNPTFPDLGPGTSFATTATIPIFGQVGSVPVNLAVGDFNGDGKLDVVTADQGTGVENDVVSLLLGNGDGTLRPATIIQSGDEPNGIAAADLNHDGATDVVTSNLSSGTVTSLLNANPSPTLTVVITPPASATVGQPVTYTVSVTNQGPGTATGIVLSDVLPAGVTFDSATPSQGTASLADGTVTAELGDLANGATATLTLIVTPTGTDSLADSASLTGGSYNRASSTASATISTIVTASADLAVLIDPGPGPYELGEQMTYTVAVINNGPGLADSVSLADTLPAGVTFVSAVSSQGTTPVQSDTQVTAALGDLAPGASATVTIVVRASTVGTLINSATIGVPADVTDPDLSNNQASVHSNVVQPHGTLAFATSSIVVNENARTATVFVTRTGGAGGTVAVPFATIAGGSATPGIDYMPSSGALLFKPGQTVASFTIHVLANPYDKHNETVRVVLGTPAGGADLGTAAAMLTIRDIDPDVTSPKLQTAVSLGTGAVPAGFVLGFSKGLNPASASNMHNYVLVDPGSPGLFGRRGPRTVPLRAAVYNPAAHTVMLLPAGRLRPGTFYRVLLNNRPGGLADPGGNLLAGSLAMDIARGTSLRYVDSHRNLVSLRLNGGGTLSLTRSPDGEGQVLQLINPTPFRSTLSGTVRPARRGARGITTLAAIQGAGPFGRVRIALSTPPFYVRQPLYV